MPKFYAACGAVGFGLSFLTGLFSGASFALVFARALVFGAVFAALSLLFHLLLKRFVPELLDKSSAAALEAEARSGPSAANLDITITDEGEDSFPEDSVPDFMKGESGGESPEAEASGENPEGANAETGNFSGAVPQAGLEPVPAVQEEGASAEGGLEALPDVSDFENLDDSASEEAASEFSPYDEDSNVSQGFESVFPQPQDVFDSEADVQSMSRAIRTVLSKE